MFSNSEIAVLVTGFPYGTYTNTKCLCFGVRKKDRIVWYFCFGWSAAWPPSQRALGAGCVHLHRQISLVNEHQFFHRPFKGKLEFMLVKLVAVCFLCPLYLVFFTSFFLFTPEIESNVSSQKNRFRKQQQLFFSLWLFTYKHLSHSIACLKMIETLFVVVVFVLRFFSSFFSTQKPHLWTQYIISNQFSTYLFLISLVCTIQFRFGNRPIAQHKHTWKFTLRDDA